MTKKIFTPVVATPVPAKAGPISPVSRNAWPKMTSSAANSRSASKVLSCFMLGHRGRRLDPPGEQARRIDEWPEQQVLHADEVGGLLAEAEHDPLALVRH